MWSVSGAPCTLLFRTGRSSMTTETRPDSMVLLSVSRSCAPSPRGLALEQLHQQQRSRRAGQQRTWVSRSRSRSVSTDSTLTCCVCSAGARPSSAPMRCVCSRRRLTTNAAFQVGLFMARFLARRLALEAGGAEVRRRDPTRRFHCGAQKPAFHLKYWAQNGGFQGFDITLSMTIYCQLRGTSRGNVDRNTWVPLYSTKLVR